MQDITANEGFDYAYNHRCKCSGITGIIKPHSAGFYFEPFGCHAVTSTIPSKIICFLKPPIR
ncbi:hypothetical protein DET0255 [Dehalococcoides mccartyi 195]|uniref:Uncharacterized protein n=1 Tax=Dehalococcoides mccartyi (strain ATCC BAA-2266 / KCTC 15142 / 195) TaxID=243164 RepID=Q3Z9S3_DEHM1|nr:hypothetical protein DET0888 [Dehalococcoides mccartyi 195]AAW40422.1 hypothetical protein DET0278 [Dehalococcoides mccartyi 195]AAW40461.1 hypothetical protein DET0255 [Dehalococcoides mccartyi 195]